MPPLKTFTFRNKKYFDIISNIEVRYYDYQGALNILKTIVKFHLDWELIKK